MTDKLMPKFQLELTNIERQYLLYALDQRMEGLEKHIPLCPDGARLENLWALRANLESLWGRLNRLPEVED